MLLCLALIALRTILLPVSQIPLLECTRHHDWSKWRETEFRRFHESKDIDARHRHEATVPN